MAPSASKVFISYNRADRDWELNGARVQYDASSDNRWDRTPPEGVQKCKKTRLFRALFAFCRAHGKTLPFFHELTADIINTLQKIALNSFDETQVGSLERSKYDTRSNL